jgi:hypothetical protein
VTLLGEYISVYFFLLCKICARDSDHPPPSSLESKQISHSPSGIHSAFSLVSKNIPNVSMRFYFAGSSPFVMFIISSKTISSKLKE